MENLPITIIDIVVLILAVLSGLLAAMRGFVREILSIGAWVGAVLAAIYGFEYAIPYAEQLTDITWLSTVGTYLALGLASLVALSLLSHSVSKGVRESAIGALDRSLGFLFGVVRAVFLICVVYFVGLKTVSTEENLPDMVTDARSYPYIQIATENLLSLLPKSITSGADKASSDIRQSIDEATETKRQLDRLNNLLPAGDQDNNAQPAYNDEERSEMNELFQDNQ